jgi:hypothetical protein
MVDLCLKKIRTQSGGVSTGEPRAHLGRQILKTIFFFLLVERKLTYADGLFIQ